jgi:hypothetical protein
MKIVDLHQYRKIYGFSYDYRNATNVPAKDLGLIIDSLASQGYEIDLLGHSRGGLICRATLENYSKTRKVLNFYSVCTPHEGVALANMGQLMSYLRKDYLNSTDDNDQPFGVLAFDTEAAAELFPNCSFIKKINDPSRIMFRGSVNYHIIGAKEFGITGGDYLAGGDTGLAKNVSLGQITAGAINRYYLPNNSHGSLLKTNDGLDELVHSAFVRTQGYLVFTVEPSDAHINLSANRWYFDLKFFNPVSKTYKFIDMSIDVYDKNAVWSSGCWYSPLTQSPDKFPKTYTFWNEFILPHATHYIPLESKTDEFETPYDDLFPADKAVTLAFIVRYQDTETLTYYSQRVVSRLIGPAGYPVEPTWRSPARGIAKNVHILRPGK